MGETMFAYRIILTVCLAVFPSSCAATPVLTSKISDMSMAIKKKAPIVMKIDVSPDGRYVLSGGFGSFILWDIQQGKKVQTFNHKMHKSPVIRVAFSPDGKYFASGCSGTKLWDLISRQEIMSFYEDDRFDAIAFSPDGKQFLCGGGLGGGLFTRKPPIMKSFDVKTGREIRDFRTQSSVFSAVYSPDGKYILTGGRDMTIWNA